VWRRRTAKLVLVAGMAATMSGCQYVGPIAIDGGRDRYNSVLHSTAKVQTLANIVRTYRKEPTTFIDVTEVDATQTLTGGASGAVTGIGAKPGTYGTLGSITPSVTYSEAPLIHYVPLVGQGLVSQLVTPVGVDALESLINSNWPADVVLDMATVYVTPDARLNGLALNIISALYADDDVTLVAGKSDLTAEQSSTANQTRGASSRGSNGNGNSNNASRPPADDTLTIFRQPLTYAKPDSMRLWQLLVRIYQGTRANSECSPSEQPNVPPNPLVSQNCSPSTESIELRTVAVTPQQKTQNAAANKSGATSEQKMSNADLQTRAPVMRTLSALGILRGGTESKRIEFVSPEEYREIRNEPWNKDSESVDFYTKAYKPSDFVGHTVGKYGRTIMAWLNQPKNTAGETRLLYEPANPTLTNIDFIGNNNMLFVLRRYVLIIMDEAAPADAYVAYPFEGKWYYIAGDDEVSKKNFNLTAMFLTIMAVPSTTPQIGATVAVGG
jgi:hypothetical protein